MKRGERVIGGRELKSGMPAVQSAEREHLDRLAAKGVVRRRLGRLGLHPLVKPARPGSVSALVIEDRR